jgi:hypothetical protein
MRLRAASLLVLGFGVTAVWACSLNPQPLPPETYDAGSDSTAMAAPDGAGGADVAVDVVTTPNSDAATDADAAVDAQTDASEADAEADATFDARPE